ncbi:MAG: hypothetical protein QOH56_597 [Pseudonocardiales bacterium]|nr:hypothetical protein [Frankiales bacterium]MDQ1734346.1 hypothetical protein [Pseudonocardiales bacterium]
MTGSFRRAFPGSTRSRTRADGVARASAGRFVHACGSARSAAFLRPVGKHIRVRERHGSVRDLLADFGDGHGRLVAAGRNWLLGNGERGCRACRYHHEGDHGGDHQ